MLQIESKISKTRLLFWAYLRVMQKKEKFSNCNIQRRPQQQT